MILATVISVGPNHLENKNCPDHFLHLFGCQAASKFPSNPQCVTWSHRLRVAMCLCCVLWRERLSILVYALQLYSFSSTGGQENKQEIDDVETTSFGCLWSRQTFVPYKLKQNSEPVFPTFSTPQAQNTLNTQWHMNNWSAFNRF